MATWTTGETVTATKMQTLDNRVTTLEGGGAAWTTMTLAANNTYSDTSFFRPAYRITSDGRTVMLRGMIRPTASIAAAGSLATGLPIPANIANFIVASTSAGAVGVIRVNSGTGVLFTVNALTTANFVPLDGLSYSLDANT